MVVVFVVYVIRCTTGWEELPVVVVTVTFLPTATSEGSCDVGSIMYVTVDPSARTIVTDLPASYVRTVPLTPRVVVVSVVVDDAIPGATVVSVDCWLISWCVVAEVPGSGAAGVASWAAAKAAKAAIMPAEMRNLDFMVTPFRARRPIPALMK